MGATTLYGINTLRQNYHYKYDTVIYGNKYVTLLWIKHHHYTTYTYSTSNMNSNQGTSFIRKKVY